MAVVTAGCVLALYLGVQSGEGSIKLLLTIAGILFIIAIYFGFYTFYWITAIAAWFFPGNFNFLPLGFHAFEVMLIVGVSRFMFDHVIFYKKSMRFGPRLDLWILLGIIAILFYHGLQQKFGMRIFGSAYWGGRAYVECFFGFATYIILQTVKLDMKAWKWLPAIAFFPPVIDAGFKIVTKFIPGLAPIIFPFYSGVTRGGAADMFSMADSDYANTLMEESRLGAWGAIGIPLALVIVSYVPLKKLWKPQYWIFIFLLAASLILSVMAGYRSTILGFALMMIAASIRDFKSKVWIFVLLGTLLMGGVLLAHNYSHWKMPLSAQRALVFLPGNWDPIAVQTAKGSDEFRFETWERWEREYFSKNPAFGRGLGFPVRNRKGIWGNFQLSSLTNQKQRESLALAGELHNGFLSVVDRVGVVGCFLFVIWWTMTVWRIFRCLYCEKYSRFNPALAWVAIYLTNWTLLYVVGSLKFDHFFGPQLVLVGVMIRMMKEADLAASEKEKHSEELADVREPIFGPS